MVLCHGFCPPILAHCQKHALAGTNFWQRAKATPQNKNTRHKTTFTTPKREESKPLNSRNQ